jgi:hypothetical protein
MTIEQRSKEIIDFYNRKTKKVWRERRGGPLRSFAGSFVETLCEMVVEHAWAELGGKKSRIRFDKRKYEIRDEKGNVYGLSQDKQVYVDDKFVLSIECKAYCEVAMYKRIMVDALLLQTRFKDLNFCLFQRESMLGGDFSESINPKGSPSVNVINFYFPSVKMGIVTLLEGERTIDEPLHKKEFFKPLKPERVTHAIRYFMEALEPFLQGKAPR